MKARALIALVALLPGLAFAQGVANCTSPSAACRASKFALIAGQNLVLNYPTATTTIRASTATGGMLLNSGVTDSGSNAAFSFTTTNTITGSTLVMNIGNGASQVATITQAGNITAIGGLYGFGTVSTGDQAPLVHRLVASSAQSIERSSGTSTVGGVLAVSFATAFGAAPFCLCTDQQAAPVACGVSTSASTTAVTFTIGAARADTINWFCIGQR